MTQLTLYVAQFVDTPHPRHDDLRQLISVRVPDELLKVHAPDQAFSMSYDSEVYPDDPPPEVLVWQDAVTKALYELFPDCEEAPKPKGKEIARYYGWQFGIGDDDVYRVEGYSAP